MVEQTAFSNGRYANGSPASDFASVNAGGLHTCEVRPDGTVGCWGDVKYDAVSPPSEQFASVSAGRYHTCGVRADGSIECWGIQTRGLTALPRADGDGQFK